MKLKPEHKNFLKTTLEGKLGRAAAPNEVSNSETDALMLIELLAQRVEDLENKNK